MTEPMKPGDLLASAFALSSIRQRAIYESWIRISHRAASRMVNSHLSSSVQRMGELDTVLRCMEEDFRQLDATATNLDILRGSLQSALSDWWVGGMYEIARTLKRSGAATSTEFAALANELRLIRVPLEKYEVPNDDKLTEPMAFMPTPAREGDVPYYYDKKDPGRHHNMPRGVSARGSAMWHVLSLKPVLSERWLERRDLSDRFLAFWPASG
jgi:hypothetical protein